MRLSFAYALLACLCFTACQSSSPQAAPAAAPAVNAPASSNGIPAWATSLPRDGGGYLHAVGTGPDIASARQDALSQLAAKLSVTVNSNYEETLTVHETAGTDTFDRQTRMQLNQEVSRIRLSRYETLQEAMAGNTAYSLVRLQTSVLLRDLKAQLTDIDQQLARAVDNLAQAADNLEKLTFAQTLRALSDQARANAYVILSFEPDFPMTDLLTRYDVYYQEFSEATRNLRFFIKADPHCRYAADYIQKSLSQAGLRIERDATRVDENTMVLQISAHVRYTQPSDWTLADMRTRFKLTQGFQIPLLEETVESQGSSLAGNQQALEKATLGMLEDLKNRELLAFLGLLPGQSL